MALVVAAALAVLGLHGALSMKVWVRVAVWCAVLLAYGMAGHGELARLRPSPPRLTGYYLAIAAGGVLGGFLNAVVAPLTFNDHWELHVGILAGPVVVAVARLADRDSAPDAELAPHARQVRVLGALALVALAVVLALDVAGQYGGAERASRGFYGVLRVVRESPGTPDEAVKLLHGRISHGLQLADPARRGELTSYYGPSSGVGLAIRRHPKRLAGRPLRIGVIGLGVGTLAAWSLPGDVVRFYELDPEVARLSEGERPAFSYVRDARGEVSVSLGDGRLSLEREAPQGYDVLALDAFSSDAIPTHLLTREAFAVYLRHLAPGGVLVVHVTNRYVDLKPVVRGAAAALGLQAAHVPSLEKGVRWSSDWMVVARDRALLEDDVVSAATLPRLPHAGEVVWTDDWGDLVRVLKL
jgi:SAM-dependent methyltransferase